MLYPLSYGRRLFYYTVSENCPCHSEDRVLIAKPLMEREIKLAVRDPEAVRAKLSGPEFKVLHSRVFESNVMYDTADNSLRRAGMLIRLRQVGDRAILTWKGPAEAGPHKSRPELETAVESPENMREILAQLGYRELFRYEKYRTEYRHNSSGTGIVTFDETPIGTFFEIEGPGDWIDRMAVELGFAEKDYILDSYGQLYLKDCQRRGVEPQHMVFAS